MPYLGVSAGAMIAAAGSLGGGTRIGGVVVSPEEPGEPGEELQIEPGIGLLDLAVEVHVAQRGMLSRVVAAIESALIVDGAESRVEGSGTVWRVLPSEGGVLVSR